MNKRFSFLLFGLLAAFTVQAQTTVRTVKIAELEKLIAATDTPLVVNFWATFCSPCIQEMPYISRITDSVGKTTPVKLLFVSLDMKEAYPERIVRMLEKKKITQTCVWLNETNADIFCPKIDESWSGSIPATLFYNPKTGHRVFMEQEISPAVFRAQLTALVQPVK